MLQVLSGVICIACGIWLVRRGFVPLESFDSIKLTEERRANLVQHEREQGYER